MIVLDTDYKGYPYDVNIDTKGICVSSSNNVTQIEQSIADYEKVINKLIYYFHDEYELYLINYYRKVGEFNSIEKYYGIWNRLKQNNISFKCAQSEKTLKLNGESIIVSFSKVMKCEINNLFKVNNSIIVLAEEKNINSLFESNCDVFASPNIVKEELLKSNSIIIEALDLGYDGNSLFIYAKRDNKKLNCEKLKKIIL